ncbi:MAG: hypothetical protein DBY44_05040 [Veillonellaceae bacterium]|nr:MAG: hypothetical protein DBY44_05040 [Veillonellaceae bacterium]
MTSHITISSFCRMCNRYICLSCAEYQMLHYKRGCDESSGLTHPPISLYSVSITVLFFSG